MKNVPQFFFCPFSQFLSEPRVYIFEEAFFGFLTSVLFLSISINIKKKNVLDLNIIKTYVYVHFQSRSFFANCK